MIEAQTMLELACDLAIWFEKPTTDPASKALIDRAINVLRASTAAAQPVAWTNKAQLSFLDDPACADIPMAMWSKTSPTSPIPLYAALAKQPKDGSTVTREADRIDTAKRVALAVLNTIGAGGDNLEIYNAVLSSLSRPERGEG